MLDRDLFTELNRFVEQQESWEMGLLSRFVGAEEKEAFEELVLFRDEFSTVRDLYQHGFELACRCLWPLVATQNTVKRGSPDDFGDVHPERVPVKQRPKSLEEFDKLSNAYKIAYVRCHHSQCPSRQTISPACRAGNTDLGGLRSHRTQHAHRGTAAGRTLIFSAADIPQWTGGRR